MKRILIIQTAFLGDVILATPLVSELRRLYPDSSIDFLCKKGNESLLTNNPKLNEVIILDKSNGKFKSIRQLIKRNRSIQYDLIINLHRFGSSGLIAGLSKGKEVRGFSKNPFSFLYNKKFEHKIGNGTHEVERNLQTILDLGAHKLVRPELFPSTSDYAKIKPLCDEGFVCMAPASVWFTKQLPKEKWIELVNKTPEKVFLIGGPGDHQLCQEIKEQSSNKNIENLAGELTLLQSAALIEKAHHVFVNDSGPLHIASAMNTPVTAFFCSTVPSFGFGPLSDDQEIKEVEGLDCKPCGLHGHKECPKGHFKCGLMQEI